MSGMQEGVILSTDFLRNIPGYIDFYLFLYIFNLFKSFLLSCILYMSLWLGFSGETHPTSQHK